MAWRDTLDHVLRRHPKPFYYVSGLGAMVASYHLAAGPDQFSALVFGIVTMSCAFAGIHGWESIRGVAGKRDPPPPQGSLPP